MALVSWLRRDLTIDPGSTHTVIASTRHNVLARERSRLLLAAGPAPGNTAPQVLALGTESLSRPTGGRHVQVIEPIERGRLTHPIGMDLLLREMIRKARLNPPLSLALGMRMGLVAAPHLAPADRSDWLALAVEVGRSTAQLIEAPFAAALGCGLNVNDNRAHMLLDFGGGKTYAVVTSLGGIAALAVADFGGRDLDGALQRHVERRSHVVLTAQAAEAVKCTIGSVYPRPAPLAMEAVGADDRSGFEKKVLVDDNDVRDVLIDACEPLLTVIQRCLADTPAELSGDIESGGVTLLGGSALLYGLPEFLAERLGLAFHRAEDPLNATIRGAQSLLLAGPGE